MFLTHAFFLGFVLISTISATPAATGAELKEKHPAREEQCIAKNGAGTCVEVNVTYGVNGVTCEAKCLHLDGLSKCSLRETCDYLPESGCFRKSSCTDISPLNTCRNWEKSLVCK